MGSRLVLYHILHRSIDTVHRISADNSWEERDHSSMHSTYECYAHPYTDVYMYVIVTGVGGVDKYVIWQTLSFTGTHADYAR